MLHGILVLAIKSSICVATAYFLYTRCIQMIFAYRFYAKQLDKVTMISKPLPIIGHGLYLI
jgi:hypothetical protein